MLHEKDLIYFKNIFIAIICKYSTFLNDLLRPCKYSLSGLRFKNFTRHRKKILHLPSSF